MRDIDRNDLEQSKQSVRDIDSRDLEQSKQSVRDIDSSDLEQSKQSVGDIDSSVQTICEGHCWEDNTILNCARGTVGGYN